MSILPHITTVFYTVCADPILSGKSLTLMLQILFISHPTVAKR